MKTRHFCLYLLLFSLAAASAQKEEITNFTSEVEVHPDGNLIVTETIAVVAQGNRIKHGIYRDFPTLYWTRLGLRRKVGFEVLEIQRDGRKERWSTSPLDNGLRVWIGDSNRTLPAGPYTYTIRYQTNRQLVVGEDADELYWNVTGNEWEFPIEQAVAKVRLPGGAVPLSIEGYTGPTGATDQNWRMVSQDAGLVVLETTAPLRPGEGFTISIRWPKGFLDPDANPDNFAVMLEDNPYTLLGLGGMLIVFLYYFVTWLLLGRDPPRGVIIPQYNAPVGFTPSAVRFLTGFGRVDNKSFAASVLQLAVRGALKIQDKAGFTLTKTEEEPDLLPGQKKFLHALFGGANTLVLEQTNHARLQKAQEALEKWLRNDFEKAYFVRNSGVWFFGLLLSLAPAGVALLDSSEPMAAGFLVLWLTFWTIGVNALLSAVISTLRSGKPILALPLALFSLPFLAGWFFGAWFLLHYTSPWIFAVFFTGAALNLIFYHLLKAPTLQGRAILDQIEGFRHYLGVAERDRLNLENPPERTPELFEKFLPYALALDVEQRWAEQFSEVLQSSGYEPNWYTGRSFSSLGSAGLASSLGGAMAGAIASSSSAPGSSSGGGGGGSSGGGGGGGGGGGW